jgi:DeoR/GlpR family transcriptional regulator of sugar metabolism
MDDNVVRAKRAMIASAAKTCLLVNHQRFGRQALHVLAELSDFDIIITDAQPDPEASAALAQAGIALRLAGDTA